MSMVKMSEINSFSHPGNHSTRGTIDVEHFRPFGPHSPCQLSICPCHCACPASNQNCSGSVEKCDYLWSIPKKMILKMWIFFVAFWLSMYWPQKLWYILVRGFISKKPTTNWETESVWPQAKNLVLPTNNRELKTTKQEDRLIILIVILLFPPSSSTFDYISYNLICTLQLFMMFYTIWAFLKEQYECQSIQ